MCTYKFDAVLAKGANLPKKEKDVVDPSVLDPNNTINKAKIKMKPKNNMAMAYINIAFEMNTIMNQVNECKFSE